MLDLSLPDFVAQAFTHYFHGDYLPLTLSGYWVETTIFGKNPYAQHLINLILHIANVALLYGLLRKYFDSMLSLFVCTLFAIHPLQVEPVIWISERKGLQCASLSLLAAHCSARNSKIAFVGYVSLFICGNVLENELYSFSGGAFSSPTQK
ncbi:MAG: hypothetical protein HC883_03150 [Bdellovibrionaceae bacterium]|nr:hypothetical protein [Pseudobdellovibrionaceae bacterium]